MANDDTHPIDRLRTAERIDSMVTETFAKFRTVLAAEEANDKGRPIFNVGELSADGHSFPFVSAGRPFRCVVSVWSAPTARGNLEFYLLDRFDPKAAARLGGTDFDAERGDTSLRHHAPNAIGHLNVLKQHGARELTANYVLGAI